MSQPDFVHIIFLLPAYFYSFLATKDIVALDSACVSGVIREQFLASLVNTQLPQLTCTSSCMDWILRRKVLPGRITIENFTNETDAIQLSEITSSVQEIHLADLRGFDQRLKIACLQKLVAFSPQLKKVVWHFEEDPLSGTVTHRLFAGRSSIGSNFLLLLANSCPVLTHVKIHDGNFSLINFRTILSKCRSITSIDIRDCMQLLTGQSLVIVAELCPQLEALSVNYTNRLDDSVLATIANKCTKLRCLRILEAGRRFDHDEIGLAYPSVSPSGFSSFAKICPPLETLHLSRVQASFGDILSLFGRCSGLKHLMLGGLRCSDAPAGGWAQPVLSLCPNLESIELQHFSIVTTMAASALVQHCTHLRAIDMKNVDAMEGGVTSVLAEQCSTELQSLELNIHTNVSTEALTTIAHRYPHLEKLRIGLELPTEHSFHELTTHCKNLAHLSFTACTPLDCGQSAAQLQYLQHLEVYYMRGNCDSSVLACVTRCTQLRTLHITQGARCKDKRIVHAVQQNCPRLNDCILYNCTADVIKALLSLQAARAQSKVYFYFHAYDYSRCC